MEVGIVDREKLVNIADTVRKKTGITGGMTLDDIASNITSIPTNDNNAKFDFASSKSNESLFSYLTTIDLSGWDTSNIMDMNSMFKNYSSLTSLDLSGFDTSKVMNMNEMFSGCISLTSLDLSGFNTSMVTDMLNMFNGCSSLTSLNVSGFNTSNVNNMANMFNGCSSLTSLDVSNFDTSNATNILGMFKGCSSLISLDVSGFNTSMVTSIGAMFNGCSSLTSLDVSGFDTSKVINMINMFDSCSSLTSLDVSNFDTTNVQFMNFMFNSCSSLTTLDLSNFNTSMVSEMKSMFKNCYKLSNLTLGTDWASNSSLSSFELSDSPLTHESAVDVINKLATRSNSPVIKFSKAVGLYQSEIDIATNKGWSVSGCTVLEAPPTLGEAESATVGQSVLIDGVISKCVYVADTPQKWGQRIFASQSEFIDSNGNSTFQWGGGGTATGITATAIGTGLTNTNALLAMNLQSTDGTPTIWDALKEFRTANGDRWFIPSRDEGFESYKQGMSQMWTSSEYDSSNAYTTYEYSDNYTAKEKVNMAFAFTYV